jgi:hypothetical protein
MLLETTQKGYAILRDAICNLYNIVIELLPLFYIATKHYVSLESREIDLLPKFIHLLPSKDKDRIKKLKDSNDHAGKKQKVKAKYYSKIMGGYTKIYELLISKLCKRVEYHLLNRIVMFDSFNGANHLETTEVKVNLISFSSTYINKYLLSLDNYSTTQSSLILT